MEAVSLQDELIMFIKFWAWLVSFFKKTPMLQESLNESIHNSLVRMGATPDKVADFLRGQGIQGKRFDVLFCPISCWLRRITPNKPGYETYLCVSSSTFTVTYQTKIECATAAHGALPMAVVEFIRLFDYKDSYQDLETNRP